MDCSPPGFSIHGNSPDKNAEVCCPALLQRIFSAQGSNPGLWQCRWILHCLSHQRSPLDYLTYFELVFPSQTVNSYFKNKEPEDP